MAEEKGPTAPPGLKIVVVGPTQGGKTTVANYVAADEAVDFDPVELMPAPFPGEEFDARLETRFAQLSAKVG